MVPRLSREGASAHGPAVGQAIRMSVCVCVCVRERGERGEREARGRERVCVEELEEREVCVDVRGSLPCSQLPHSQTPHRQTRSQQVLGRTVPLLVGSPFPDLSSSVLFSFSPAFLLL